MVEQRLSGAPGILPHWGAHTLHVEQREHIAEELLRWFRNEATGDQMAQALRKELVWAAGSVERPAKVGVKERPGLRRRPPKVAEARRYGEEQAVTTSAALEHLEAAVQVLAHETPQPRRWLALGVGGRLLGPGGR